MSTSEHRTKTVNKQIRMTPEEEEEISKLAAAFGYKSVPQYMRDCAMLRPMKSQEENRAITAFERAVADLGRLGGLQKKWLTGDWKPVEGNFKDIKALLKAIEEATHKVMDAADVFLAEPKRGE